MFQPCYNQLVKDRIAKATTKIQIKSSKPATIHRARPALISTPDLRLKTLLQLREP